VTTFTDDFNRANGAPGANWVDGTGLWTIVSNQLSSGTSGGTIVIRAATAMATNDNSAQVTIAATGSVSHGVWCRGNTGFTSGYLWRNDGTSWVLFSNVGGSFTSIGSFAGAAVAGDIAKVTAVGSTITGYVNGIARVTVTNTAVTTGTSVGLRAESSGVLRFDDFTASDVTSGVSGDAALAATATLTAAGVRSTSSGAALASTATLTAAGTRSASGGAALASTATLSAAGVRTTAGDAALAATASLTASGVRATSGAASFAATAALAADGTRTATGTAALAATATLTASGTVTTSGDAALTAAATFTADGQRTTAGVAALAATATLTADGQRTTNADAALAVTAALAASGTRSTTADTGLAATAVIAVIDASEESLPVRSTTMAVPVIARRTAAALSIPTTTRRRRPERRTARSRPGTRVSGTGSGSARSAGETRESRPGMPAMSETAWRQSAHPARCSSKAVRSEAVSAPRT